MVNAGVGKSASVFTRVCVAENGRIKLAKERTREGESRRERKASHVDGYDEEWDRMRGCTL